MKLIEILVRELPKRGGWPIGIDKLVQNSIGCVYQAGGGPPLWRFDLAQDWELAEISRGEYYIALDASKEMLVNKPVAWDGKGFPPVGSVARVKMPGYNHPRFDRFIGKIVTVIAHDRIDSENVAVFRSKIDDFSEEFDYHALTHSCFEPICKEEERKREAAVNAMIKHKDDIIQPGTYYHAIYDAIAAGKIPGVKLESPDED